MTEHIVGPNPAVLSSFTDGAPRIRAGTWFYATAYDGWTCTGGRVYIPAGSTAIGKKIKISAYHRTAGGIPASDDVDLNIANAIRTVTVASAVAGWNEVKWTGFTFNNSSASNFIFIGYEVLTSADAFTGIYVAGSIPGAGAVQMSTLAGMWLAESGFRGMYTIGAGESGLGTVNATWYGADIIIDDNAAVTGNEISAFEGMTAADFSNVTESGVTYNLATEFYVTRQAWLTKFRLMMPTSGNGNLNQRFFSLWDVDGPSSGTQEIGPFPFTPGTFGVWNVFTLPTPYQLVAGKRYRAVVRVNAADGYVAKPGHFTGADYTDSYLVVPNVTNAIGTDQGSFTTAGDSFPDQSFNNSFYGIDVAVVDSLAEPPVSPYGAAAFTHTWAISATGHTPGYDSVRQENTKPGEDPAQVTISGAGDLTNLGYAWPLSVDDGETVDFYCSGAGTIIDIYRIGYYGNAQWHKVTTISNTATTQPVPNAQVGVNGGFEASNWSTTASWAVPRYAMSGLYVGVYRSNPGPNASFIPFVVRNDDRAAKIVVKVSETTWGAAYNNFGVMADPMGGKNVYGMNTGVGNIADRTHHVSFRRPIITRHSVNQTYWMACELPLITWLERNGYDVKYVTGADLDRDPTILDSANIFVSSGHDEYWSDGMRNTVENWRLTSTASKPTHALFMSGNEVFWRIRFNADRSGFFCYKDTMPGPGGHVAGTPLDPVSWTGTWKDNRWSGRKPEWVTTGTDFRMNGVVDLNAVISSATYGSHPVWANTALTSGNLTLTGCVGFEADQIHPTQPAASQKILAAQVINIDGRYADNNGENYSGNGSLNPWGIIAQRYGVKSVTVGFGTCQWSWLLSDKHDRFSVSNENINAKQFMVNLLGDLEAQPDGLEAGLVARTAVSLDNYGLAAPGQGAAAFTDTWTITATGFTPSVGMRYGAAAFTDQWNIGAVGTRPGLDMPQGAAAFTDAWTISAEGITPPDPIPHGSAHFTNEWTIGAVGTRNPQGRASFVDRWTITARGAATPFSNPISKTLDDLAVCLCAQMEMDGLPPTCFCGVMPGNEVALDYAGNCDDVCGMAWVRLITSYPSLSVGAASERPGNCAAGIGFDVEIGIVRCLEVEADGEPPSAEVMLEAARLQHADLLAMWRAIACCRTSKDWVLGQYQPYGPEGTIVGGTFQIGMTVF